MNVAVNWSYEQELLNFGVSEEIISLLKDEGINKTSFFELTENDLKDMQMKIGPRKIILKIIRERKENYQDFSDGIIIADYRSVPNGPEQVLQTIAPTHSTSNCSINTTIPLDNSFSRYGNVTSTLLNHSHQGETVIKAANTLFSEENRREMIRILVSELITFYNNCYPPENAKIALAKAIVEEFPLLKDPLANKGYEHYYNENTKQGFIEYRLWTVRTHLSPSKKKYKTKSQKVKDSKKHNLDSTLSELLPKEELYSKIAWMKFKSPSEATRKDIEKALMDTLPNRRQWILSTTPTISDIFKQYPRLLDFKGDMIDQDFECLFKNKGDNFLQTFSSYYCKKILLYAKQNRYDIYNSFRHITEENLKALMILSILLPANNSNVSKKNTNSKGGQKKKQNKRPRLDETESTTDEQKEKQNYTSFLKIVPAGTNVMYDIQETASASNSNVQPYILCVCGQKEENTYIVQGDGWLIQPSINSAVNAFDLLFKTYFVLNVCYPIGLQNFFNFIEKFIYQLQEAENRALTTSLHINICNVKDEDEDENDI